MSSSTTSKSERSRTKKRFWFSCLRRVVALFVLCGICVGIGFGVAAWPRRVVVDGSDSTASAGPQDHAHPRDADRPPIDGGVTITNIPSEIGIERRAECVSLSRESWETLRELPAVDLSVDPSGDRFVVGRPLTVGRFAIGEPKSTVLVLGQLTCKPCMEELPILGAAAREHPSVRIAGVLLEGDWDGRGPPYAGGQARRLAESGLSFAAVAQDGLLELVRAVPGLKFPAFVFVSSQSVPEKICFGAVTTTTPEGRELQQWLRRESVFIPE